MEEARLVGGSPEDRRRLLKNSTNTSTSTPVSTGVTCPGCGAPPRKPFSST